MRNLITGLIIGIVAGVLLAVSVPAPPGGLSSDLRGQRTSDSSSAPVQWRLASIFPDEFSPQGSRIQDVLRTVASLSGGKINIRYHGPGALVPALDVFDAVASGVIDAGFSSPSFWADKSPALQLFGGTPFGPGPAEFLAWYRSGGGQEFINGLYKPLGIHSVLCGIEPAAGGGWFRTPVQKPADLKALRLAATGLSAEVLTKLGAKTENVPLADIAAQLAAGALDGAVASVPSTDRTLGLQENLRNYYFPGWHKQAGALDLLINIVKWNQLGDSQKRIIELACAANVSDSLASAEASQFNALKTLVVSGINVARWDAPVIAALRASWRRVAAEQAANDKQFRAVWRSLRQFREDYGIWRELGYL